MSGNFGGLLGTAIGFVITLQGIKLVTDATKDLYKKKGYRIHPIHKLKHHLRKHPNKKQYRYGYNFPSVKIPRYV